jgi:hypothetical protein
MRHVLASRPEALRSQGVRQTPAQATLVTPAGIAQRLPTRIRTAPIGAIHLAAVAVRADMHVLAATRAEKKAEGVVHRRSAIGRRAIDRRAGRVLYCTCTCACHGGGHDIRMRLAG